LIAYIAGPYRAKTKLGIIRNILKARKAAKEFWAKGYTVICPHMNSALMKHLPEEVFIEGDLEILKKSDVLVVMKGWQKSEGTKREIDFAKKNGIAIIWM
jgi:hypothetical protein